jgi:dolichyl-phosphate-mannose-protein mannosyltransferase
MNVRRPDAVPFASNGVALPRVCAAVLVILGFLPIANWIPGGRAANWYATSASEWLSGSSICVGAAIVAFIVLRRMGVWPGAFVAQLVERADKRPNVAALLLSTVSLALYGLIARAVFSGKPLLIDEIIQVFQARIFATGRLALPVSPIPEFFSALHVVDFRGQVFSQFPPGGPLMLLPGVLLGVPWLTGPVFGAMSAAVYWRLMHDYEPRRTVALGAALLFALAPFTAFMAGSHMNHVPTLFWLCVAVWCLQRMTRESEPSVGLALGCGLSFGIMATIRPTDAVAFALPAAIWLLARAWRAPHCWRDVVIAGVGVGLPILALLAFNVSTTGQPFLFGYELLWGKSHALGFHRAPWGITHTPARGLELVNLYFLRLQTYLFESSLPSLIPCALALVLTPRLRGFDRYLLWSSALLVASYFAYWHDGFFLGPRFFYPLLPTLALWTARFPGLVRTRLPRLPGADRVVVLTYVASACLGLMASLPLRVRQYASGLTSMRQDYMQPARSAGASNALILVRESWGAQLIARLWGLGVPHSETETLYRGIDTCALEMAVSNLERTGQRGSSALNALRPLLRDSARVVTSKLSPDTTERVLPSSHYDPVCMQRIIEDRSGYTFLAPILAVSIGSNVYARDLHARDTLLVSIYGGRKVYVLRPASNDLGAHLVLIPLSLDSARADWRAPSEF